MRTIFCILAGLAAVAILGAAGPRASASVMDYHAFVQSHSDTLVQYDFDGSTDVQRREDKKGSNDLIQMLPATMYNLSGFDASSRAVSGGFFTTSPISMPADVSFEAIVAPTATTGNGYLVASYDGARRGYFALGSNLKLAAAAGNFWGNQSTYANSYVVGDWYYLAATMSYNSGANQTTINTYMANLSENETILTHSPAMTNVVVPGDFHTGLVYGIGLINSAGNPTEPLAGFIDEVTFFSGLKNQAFFQANLDRVFATSVPEPSSALLLLAGIGILGVIVRRRRFHPGFAQAVRSDG